MQLNCCSSTPMILCAAQAFHVLMAHFNFLHPVLGEQPAFGHFQCLLLGMQLQNAFFEWKVTVLQQRSPSLAFFDLRL